MNKIIMLDIDGPLCIIPESRDQYGSTFHDHLTTNLAHIIDKTGAKIVISSSWRKSGLVIMQEMWKFRNLPGEVIDVTPSLYVQKGGGIQFWNDKLDRHPTERVHGYSVPRGSEIQYWLECESYNCKGIDGVEAYVILDDDTDMLWSQRNNFVQCSGNLDDEDCVDAGYGLTRKCAEKAVGILNKKDR